jgi:uncharacterized membrane protein YphA (DoxX/SURF4 family)
VVPSEGFSIAARLVVAGTLLVAAWGKLCDRAGFAQGVHDYGLLPPAGERVVVYLLPAAELVVGVTLLLGVALPWSALAAALLFVLFGAAIAITARRGRDIPCHCFGAPASHRVGVGALLRTVVLATLALVAVLGPMALNPLPRSLEALTPESGVALFGMIATLVTAVVMAEPLFVLFAGLRNAFGQAPALKAAEAARRGRICRKVEPMNSEVTP